MSHTTTGQGRATPATLSQLRHDIRNYLNAIKLSAALLQRRCKDTLDLESITEIDRSADGINDLVNRLMGAQEIVSLIQSDNKAEVVIESVRHRPNAER